jgi:hypothetical protein
VLLRLAYLTAANTFALVRLLPASDRDKDAEILVLRHQIAVLERQLSCQIWGSAWWRPPAVHRIPRRH